MWMLTEAADSVFTPEFLSGIAANNLSEMLAYATNVEPQFKGSQQGYNTPSAHGADGTTSDFRVRGIAVSFAVDLMESPAPQDDYKGRTRRGFQRPQLRALRIVQCIANFWLNDCWLETSIRV